MRDLHELTGRRSVPFYVPVFEPSELEEAELVRMRVYGFCGSAFGTWSQRLGLPPGTLVMDKREMGKQDIARTHAWNEFVISERLREVFHAEDLTGWVAEPIQHIDPKRDRFGPLYWLQASSVLPPLAPETELELRRYGEEDDVLGGTTALFERGPLCYRRSELTSLADVNRTHEVFLEVTVGHPYFIFSQRARRVLLRHRARGDFTWEPMLILE